MRNTKQETRNILDGHPETVSHMLFDCNLPNLKLQRGKFLDQIQTVYPTFTAMSNMDKLSKVLNLNFKDENLIYNSRFSRNP